MENRALAAVVASIGVLVSFAAAGQPMSRAEYESARKNIESDHRTARLGCEPMTENVKEVCIADVKGRQEVALAELEVAYAPGSQARYDLRMTAARAAHAVAKKRCDDKSVIAKDACLKESEVANAAARADAEARLKADAQARATATESAADPAAAKRNAEYSDARERCDVFTGSTQVLCASDAKRRFGNAAAAAPKPGS